VADSRTAQPEDRIKDHLAKFVVGVLVIVVAATILAWLGLPGDNGSTPTSTIPAAPSASAEPMGQIVSPASGEFVGRNIDARGILADIPENQHVWLVVRDGNLLYPQDSEVTPSEGEWSLRFHQGGTTKVISLELYRMNDEGNSFIAARFKASNYSGISQIPGARRLDIVENLRIQG
jgi:hypothetical protein